ncbi:hypothetical protein GGR32_000970 [Mesonia hippocampi]|uniref:Uncharacterized protein n=1 Tax=Mesonia hippocampi TaxID=1628250 RepID=A0A840ENZ0_9FLAO|nr:hypothetical protein [Mesonia hippocampi]MBB4118690.1 hypothetical protein [Mesonia hippocampi]
MKKIFYLTNILLLSSFIFACAPTNINYQNEYDTSKKTWESFKKSTGNSYQYTVSNSSWTGITQQTTITVKKGKVIQREFKQSHPQSSLKEIDNIAWIEKGKEINTHKNGTEAITLDEVYKKVKNNWLIKRENAKVYFETKNNGIISTCGYVEPNCADDCFKGIRITNIKALTAS